MTINYAGLSGENEASYYSRAIREVERGETTWVRRNFDADLVAYDLYVDKIRVGCIIQDDGGGFEGYLDDVCVTGDELVSQDLARAAVVQAHEMQKA